MSLYLLKSVKFPFSCFSQATLQLTEEQQEAMMHLRRLFYGKLGALKRHRQQLLQQVRAFPPSRPPSS